MVKININININVGNEQKHRRVEKVNKSSLKPNYRLDEFGNKLGGSCNKCGRIFGLGTEAYNHKTKRTEYIPPKRCNC